MVFYQGIDIVQPFDVAIIGAGAAGCFAAILLGELNPSLRIAIVEKTRQPLSKVRISGGGRCNVTHHCFEVERLISCYPRGRDFLRGGFHRFQPRDMMAWLQEHGVELKTEEDGRCFPSSNRSQTVIDCFMSLIDRLFISLKLGQEVCSLEKKEGLFYLEIRDQETIVSKRVLVATGGMQRSYGLLERLGHTMRSPIPSLFTFELEEEWIKSLAGSTAPSARVALIGTDFSFTGPLLVTHWGVSGPAVLKLSAFAARWLFTHHYQARLQINWTGLSKDLVEKKLGEAKKQLAGKKVEVAPLFSLSKRCWKELIIQASPSLEHKVWGHVTKQEMVAMQAIFTDTQLTVLGKSLNKEEFVTCGGVALEEIHPKTMESKKVPGLYMAGEVIDVDGITGGFNFQNAWTGAFLAAQAIDQSLKCG